MCKSSKPDVRERHPICLHRIHGFLEIVDQRLEQYLWLHGGTLNCQRCRRDDLKEEIRQGASLRILEWIISNLSMFTDCGVATSGGVLDHFLDPSNMDSIFVTMIEDKILSTVHDEAKRMLYVRRSGDDNKRHWIPRDKERVSLSSELASRLVSREPTAEDLAIQHEQKERLHWTISTLNDPLLETICRLRLGGLTLEEIAGELDLGVPNVVNLWRRAKRILRRNYGDS